MVSSSRHLYSSPGHTLAKRLGPRPRCLGAGAAVVFQLYGSVLSPGRLFILCGFFVSQSLAAAEIILTDPSYGKINSGGLDQPRLYALVSDPAQGNAFITWQNPLSGDTEPALLTAFIDTGASGFAISHLHATGDLEQADLGFGGGDYLGPFTEIGIGGEEIGDVTRPFGIWVRNGAPGLSEEVSPAEFTAYGSFNLWVRRNTGTGEVNDFLGASPINLIGMPVIRQRRLLLDPTPMTGLAPMETALLAPGEPEPATQATVSLVLRDFISETPPAGEVLPSHYANPMVPGLVLREGSASVTGEWLLDTGASSSFASFAMAKAAGLIPAGYATLAEFMEDYTGLTSEIGGIGASRVVPVLNVDRITVPTREGATLVWENVDLLIADVAGLDGIFGMNLLVPAVTLNPADPFGSIFDISPGAFTAIVIDTTDAADPVIRFATPFAGGTVFGWLGEHFNATERLQPELGGLAGDADGDGLANLIEYALGQDPRLPAPASARPWAGVSSLNGEVHPTFTFTRRLASNDVSLAVEISNDLVNWRPGEAELVTVSSTTNGGLETRTYRTNLPSAPGGRTFFRLAAFLAP
jgi:hypothetical protein